MRIFFVPDEITDDEAQDVLIEMAELLGYEVTFDDEAES